MKTPRTDLFAQNYAPLTIESCLAWARQLEQEIADTRRAWLGRDYDHLPLPEAVGAMRAHIEDEKAKLREALIELLRAAPTGNVCDNFNHSRADRHSSEEACPRIRRWEAAKTEAQSLLARTK